MIFQNNLSIFFTSSWLILFFSGFLAIFLGNKIKGLEKWTVWIAFSIFFISVGIESGFFSQENVASKVFLTNWLSSQELTHSLYVGLIQDSIAFMMCGLVIVSSSALLFHQMFYQKEKHSKRIFGAIAISASGVCLSWCSQTPWLGFLGLSISILGSFFSFGSRWNTNKHADLLSYFLREKMTGMILIFIGACILSATGSTLVFDSQFSFFTESSFLLMVWIGAIILFFGFFIQLQSFPFIGSLVYNSDFYPPIRHLLHQIFPAWCVYAFLFRFYTPFLKLGIFPAFGWLAILSVILLLISGLFQKKWYLGLGIWIAAGLVLSLVLLAFSGPQISMSLLIGVSLGGLGISFAGSSIDPDFLQHHSSKTDPKKTLWVKAALFLSMFAGIGMFSFVSNSGLLRWFIQSLSEPNLDFVLFILVIYLFAWLGWKLCWNINKTGKEVSATWGSLFSLYIIIFLTLGIFWTGSPFGEVLPDLEKQIMPSIFKKVFEKFSSDPLRSNDYLFGSGVYWGTLFLSAITAYWISGGKEEKFIIVSQRFPKVIQFLASGYRIDEIEESLLNNIQKLSARLVYIVDDFIWKKWIPKIILFPILKLTNFAQLLNQKVIYGISYSLKITIESMAKFLQMIQTGDVRWYLFVSLISGFLIIIYHLQW